MKGLMTIVIPFDTDRGDTALAMRRALSIAEGMGVQENRQPQVVAKQLYAGEPGTLPDDFKDHPNRYITANDYHYLQAIGFDPPALGVDVIADASEEANRLLIVPT